MTPNEVQTIILDHWPDAQEGAGGFAQVASQSSLHKIGEATFKRICGELKVAGIARWEVVPKVIGRMQELAKDAPTGGDLSRGDRARHTTNMICSAASGRVVLNWPGGQDLYQRAVDIADAAGRKAVFGDLIRAKREAAKDGVGS